MTPSARYGLLISFQVKTKKQRASSIALRPDVPDSASMFVASTIIHPSLRAVFLPPLGRFWPIHALLRAATDLVCVLACWQATKRLQTCSRGGAGSTRSSSLAAALERETSSSFLLTFSSSPSPLSSLSPPKTPLSNQTHRSGRATSSRSWAGRTSRASR